ncbi:MAG: glycosyltransferase family 4 protein [Calditrichia bacterium]
MRVLLATILNPEEDTNGVISHIFDLRRELLLNGIEVQLASVHERKTLFQRCDYVLRRTAYHCWNRYRLSALFLIVLLFIALRMALTLRSACKECDLVNAQDVVSAGIALLVLPKSVPILLTCHFWSAPWKEFSRAGFVRNKRLSYYLLKWFFRRVLRNPRISLISVSHSNLDLITDITSDSSKKIPVIYSGQMVFKQPAHNESNEADRKEKIILNVGTLSKRKNQRFLVDVAQELNLLGKRWRYVLIGPEDPDEGRLIRSKIKKYQLESQFHLLGEQDRTGIFTLLRQADIYFQTSTSESFGIAILEAMAHNTLVVALDYPALQEIMPNTESLRLSQKLSAKEVAEKIAEIDSDIELQNILWHLQYQHLVTQFDPHNMLNRYLTLYQGLLRNGEVPETLL